MTHKTMTANIRKRIQQAGIKARVRMNTCNEGGKTIQVITPSYDYEWSVEEQRKINFIAQCNNLTKVRQMPINLDAPISTQVDFYYWGK